MTRKLQIGVIGSAGAEEYPDGKGTSLNILRQAEKIGELLAQKGATVVTGGKGGIMEAAARGAKKINGLTVGIVSGRKRFSANNFTDVEVITGMVSAGLDELFLVLMSDALIVLGGGAGTLEEIAIAYRNNKPVVVVDGSGGWSDRLSNTFLDERSIIIIEGAKTPRKAVERAIVLAASKDDS